MDGKQFAARVLDNTPINAAASAYLLRVEVPASVAHATPGQFVHVLCGNPEERPLRRAFAICATTTKPATLSICYHVVGDATAWLAERKTGESMDMLAPLGHGFTKHPVSRALLCGGGRGMFALLPLAKAYGKHATVLLSYPKSEMIHFDDAFRATGATVHVYTEEQTAALLRDAKRMVHGGMVGALHLAIKMSMMRTIAEDAVDRHLPCEVMLTPKLACGVGACRGCTRMMRENGRDVPRQVCHDGPVFDAKHMLWDSKI